MSTQPNKQQKERGKNDRQEKALETSSLPKKETVVHPFMERLFSADLRAVHGPTFGDLCSDSVEGEHHFLTLNLDRIFALNDWDHIFCSLMDLESVIRYCPKLKNEAGAIRALIEAEKVLGDFCRAVKAC
ncbi:hypothetical protein P4E94_14830 [Pontiellaceae bacterium B12219]|nr:hypothetical protein [Pontiellaceae bacterium B12219]